MRKAYLFGPQHCRIEDRPMPEPGPREVVVRIAHGSLCSSDVGQWKAGPHSGKPGGFGHDASGVVESVGSQVTLVSPGTEVTIAGWMPCGQCVFCQAGEVVKCKQRITARPDQAGFFSEYMAIPEELAIPLQPGVTLDDGALIEAAYTGINGARVMGYHPGDLVVLIGAGWMAWGQIAVAAGRGARVVALARNPGRLALARRFGAFETFAPDDPELDAKLQSLNGGERPNYLIDATGGRTPDGIALAEKIGAIGATVGLMARKENVRLNEFVTKHMVMKSIAVAPVKAEAVAMIADGKLDLKPCISHRFSFERLPEALEFLANDRDSVTKIMIDMPGFEVAGATAT